MKNSKLSSLILTIGMIASAYSLNVHAQDKAGNGGDICEDRFKIVRDDIRSWINSGGSAGLSLPKSVSLNQYNKSMLVEISAAQISCIDSEINVDGAEKTCKNFVDPHGTPQIVCNNTRFMQTSDSDQYVLVHHEYAGLSGFEVNDGESSQYPISNQISGYLANETVKKLAVKAPAADPKATDPVGAKVESLFQGASLPSVQMLGEKTTWECQEYQTVDDITVGANAFEIGFGDATAGIFNSTINITNNPSYHGKMEVPMVSNDKEIYGGGFVVRALDRSHLVGEVLYSKTLISDFPEYSRLPTASSDLNSFLPWTFLCE